MLKFESVATIGDRIRAYDFEPLHGREDSFVEGRILRTSAEQGYKAFIIVCDFDSMDNGKWTRVSHEIAVPMGTSMDYDGRVTKIS